MRSDETLTNTNLGWDVEAVSLLSIELGGVEDDGDLALQDHEHHGVLVGAAHALGAVTLDHDKKTRQSQSAEDLISRNT